MANNRTKGGRDLNQNMRHVMKKISKYGFILSLLLASFFLILAMTRPNGVPLNYYQKSLKQLRSKSKSVKLKFQELLKETAKNKTRAVEIKIPEKINDLFNTLRQLNSSSKNSGIGYYNRFGELILWNGRVIDLQNLLTQKSAPFISQKGSIVIHKKTSFYLISIQNLGEKGYIIFYRLLAFIPQFKAQYLKEYHFLKEDLMQNCSIDFWDYREDVSGFEKIFTKHNDEFIGQPRLQNEIQTIFFPLRNEESKIIATVTLSSLSLPVKLSSQRENLMLIFYIFLGISLLFLLNLFLKTPSFIHSPKLWNSLFIVLILIGLRVLFFPLSQLEAVQSLQFFSPSSASFIFLWDLAKSPADLFLTSFFLFLIINFLFYRFKKFLKPKQSNPSLLLSLFINSAVTALSFSLLLFMQKILFKLTANSSFNLLKISHDLSFIFLHIGILLTFIVIIILIYSGFKLASSYSSRFFTFIILLLLGFTILQFLPQVKLSFLITLCQTALIAAVAASAYFNKVKSKKEILAIIFILSVLLVHGTVNKANIMKHSSLVENSLQNLIKSQKNWGYFLMQQTVLEIDKRNDEIISLFSSSQPLDLANSLWNKTLLAKFNWYSSLEIIDPEGKSLSHFSLNILEPYQPHLDLPLSPTWTMLEQNLSYLVKDKDFLTAYKDWFEADKYQGRTILHLAFDYETLPFLHLANPYFELVKITSFPSLNQLNLGFVVFNMQGKPAYNPNKISSGIPPALLQKIKDSKESIWSTFSDKGNKFKCLYFENSDKIYALFIPIKSILTYLVEYLKLISLYLVFFIAGFLLFSLISSRKKWKNPFWSFSNRVYIAFTIVALIPLLVFTFSTRNFFANIFTQNITEEAEAQANFARRVMEEFILLQQEERISLTIPPDNMVLWISTTISHDVNLYVDGKLISSSRREFFDSGLLPELIDGEIYYKIQFENNPFYMQTQTIGDYSFHTLTIPYSFQESILLISLPFPQEQQEITKTSSELLEFLFFISFIFVAVVLLLARGIGGMIITPIKKLLTGTREVSLGNLEISIPHKHKDEMKTLIDGFNTMVKSLKKHQQEVADLSKKVAWAEMARKVAHEIKNPLTPIQLSAEHLLRIYSDKPDNFEDALKESTSYIVNEVENLRKIAQQFLETSKEVSLQKKKVDLKVIIKETISPYQSTLAERIEITESFSGKDFIFWGDKDKIKIILRNILTNAIESITGQGKIKIFAKSLSGKIELTITDTGTGIEKEMLTRIFEPYFSSKDSGTGLGLPIAKKIIEDHGGSIRAYPNEPKGLCVLITLRLVSAATTNLQSRNRR